MPIDVTEGWTGGLEFQLLADGAVPAGSLPGTPDLILKDKTGIAIDTTGDVTVTEAAQWKVKYTPDAADFNASGSPYTARFKVTDAGSQIVFFPSGPADVWRVHKQ